MGPYKTLQNLANLIDSFEKDPKALGSALRRMERLGDGSFWGGEMWYC